MKKLITICAVAGMILAISGTAQATLTFDFNSLANDANSNAISTYMSNIYTLAGYGNIAVTDAKARISSGDWPGNATTYIWTDVNSSERDFEILFVTTPITALLGLGGTGRTVGLVHDPTDGNDFTIFAYDSTYGNVENPNVSALVTSWSIDGLSKKAPVSIPDLLFTRPVSLLVISDSGEKDVAIDNLMVTPVPEPATIALLGMGSLTLLRRKRKI